MSVQASLAAYAQLCVDDATETEFEYTSNRIGKRKFKFHRAGAVRPELQSVVDMIDVLRSQSSGSGDRANERQHKSTIRMILRKLPGMKFYFDIIRLMRRFVYQPSDNQKQFIRRALHAMLPVVFDGRTIQGPAPAGIYLSLVVCDLFSVFVSSIISTRSHVRLGSVWQTHM